jgi:immunity protein, SdpI family
MTKRFMHLPSIAVIALGYLVGLAAYPYIPGNAIDQMQGARAQIAFSLPTATLVIYVLFRSLWFHDRVRTGNGAFEATYQAIVFRVLLFVFAMNALLMIALTDVMDVIGSHTWGKRVVVIMLGLTFVAVGNLLPRTRPNIAFGVRTARTLANTRLWQQVHRVGGYAAVAFGAVVAIAGITAPMRDTVAGLLSLAAIAAVLAVFVTYRKYVNG